MRINNTFDEILFGATLGAAPTAEDLEKVTPPPGVNPATFRATTLQRAREIAALRNAGSMGEARRAAAAAAGEYAAAFAVTGPTPAAEQDDPLALADQIRSAP